MDQPVPSVVLDILRLSVWLICLAVIFVPLERLFAVHSHRAFRKELGTDVMYYFLNSLLPAVLLGLPLSALAWTAHRLIPSGFLAAIAAVPFWGRASLGLVASEVGYYWGHRWSHEIPLLWRFHSIHHSARDMDFLVHTRAHPVDMVFGRFCGLVPLYLLGLGSPNGPDGSAVPIVVSLVGTLWGFFIHANLRFRFGPLEWMISTPAFHHWHHTRTGPINRNYSSTFPWLDALFGSLYLPKEWPEDYGTGDPIPEGLVDQLLHPLVPASQPHVEPNTVPAIGSRAECPVES